LAPQASTENEPAQSTIRFDVDSYLLLQLGEALFSSKALALAELIKNCYDADASRAVVQFDNIDQENGTITIQDDGEGMSFELLERGWMRIATYEKNRDPISRRFRRPRAGAKGVGRFACRFLSRTLIVESVAVVASGKKERVEIRFDWEKFRPGSLVGDVSIPCTKEGVPFNTPTGTKLVMRDLREKWTREELGRLRDELMSVITSFAPEVIPTVKNAKSDPGFQVVFRAPEFAEYEGPLSEQFLETYAWGRLIGKLGENGKPTYTLISRREKKTMHYTPDASFPALGPVTFRVDMAVYQKSNLPLGKESSLRMAQKVGREQGGVRVYIDGFRVPPYGEPSDDWLGLDSDRARRLTAFREFSEAIDAGIERPMLLIPGNNQLFGSVLLSRVTNPGIQVTLVRNLILDNEAFTQLKAFVRLGIEWMTVQHARLVSRGKRPKRKEPALNAIEKAEATVEKRREQIGAEAAAEITQSLKLAREAFAQREDDQISEIAMLRVLATTGTLIVTFQHELLLMVDDLKEIGEDMEEDSKKTQGPIKHRLSTAAAKTFEWVQTVRDYGEQLGLVLGAESRKRRQQYYLRPLIDVITKPFKRHFDEFGIECINKIDDNVLLPPMFRAEIVAIFLNLLTNSAKAVKENKTRRIMLESTQDDSAIRIRVLDTGPGIEPKRREEVFEPFVTDSRPDPLYGHGTGLGLTIVRNLLDTYGGTVKFLDPPDSWGACLEITIPRRNSK
jgi:signal transduction histidine kinase